MDVTPPPCTVPRLTVTYSRKILSWPIMTLVGSPAYPKCCGGPPIDANGYKSQRSPISVHPSTLTWEISLVPLPILTCAPTMQYGPTVTSLANSAFGCTMALG